MKYSLAAGWNGAHPVVPQQVRSVKSKAGDALPMNLAARLPISGLQRGAAPWLQTALNCYKSLCLPLAQLTARNYWMGVGVLGSDQPRPALLSLETQH
jgi:hypothetical protein